MRWIVRNAKQYNIDTSRLVLSGHSAGGHLSLITEILPSGTTLDNQCGGTETLKVAAIINWFGPADITDIIQGPNMTPSAVMWLGGQADALSIAKRVSQIPMSEKTAHVPSRFRVMLTP